MRRRVSQVVALGIIALLVYVSWRQAVVTGRSAKDRLDGAAGRPPRYPSVAFVATCPPSHVASDDPILHPGAAGASHEHQFFGSRVVGADTVVADLRAGASTCDDAADHAAYWMPTPVGTRWTALRAYYSAGDVDPATIAPYPMGLQIIGGRTTYGGSPDDVKWSCGREVDAPGWTSEAPDCAAADPLTVRVTFPQCWDGRSLGPDHVVAAVASACPSSHPKALPRLRLRAELVDAGSDVRFSSGAAASMHADFWNAWDPARLEALVRVCIRGERSSNTELTICRTAGAR